MNHFFLGELMLLGDIQWVFILSTELLKLQMFKLCKPTAVCTAIRTHNMRCQGLYSCGVAVVMLEKNYKL